MSKIVIKYHQFNHILFKLNHISIDFTDHIKTGFSVQGFFLFFLQEFQTHFLIFIKPVHRFFFALIITLLLFLIAPHPLAGLSPKRVIGTGRRYGILLIGGEPFVIPGVRQDSRFDPTPLV